LGRMNITEPEEPFGVRNLMDMIREEFPDLKFGYYNPPIERIKGNFEKDFAN